MDSSEALDRGGMKYIIGKDTYVAVPVSALVWGQVDNCLYHTMIQSTIQPSAVYLTVGRTYDDDIVVIPGTKSFTVAPFF